MIKNIKSLSMPETLEILSKSENVPTEVVGFIKKFKGIKVEKAKNLKKSLEELNLMKIKPTHISKIIDMMPEDSEDINKIFTDIGLDEDETKKILKTVKGSK